MKPRNYGSLPEYCFDIKVFQPSSDGNALHLEDPQLEKSIRLGRPESFEASQFSQAIDIVHKGGAIQYGPKWIAGRMKEADVVALCLVDGKTVGVAALKKPLLVYRETISAWSGKVIPEQLYPLELGYIAVDIMFRGQRIATDLFSEIVPAAGKQGLFSTSRDASIWQLLVQFGFVRAGEQRGDGLRLFHTKLSFASQEIFFRRTN